MLLTGEKRTLCQSVINKMHSALPCIVLVLLTLVSCASKKSDLFRKNSKLNIVSNISPARGLTFDRLINYHAPIKNVIDSLNLNTDDLHIEIDKSDYILSVYSGRSLIKQYPIVLGSNPVDDKLIQGDCCTPEGNYRIKDKYNHNKWSRFIWIDYPNDKSNRKFNKAKRAGIIPSESTPGGDIGIHGVPENCDYLINIGENWTLGCISLKIKDINEIYEIVKIGTRVIIKK